MKVKDYDELSSGEYLAEFVTQRANDLLAEIEKLKGLDANGDIEKQITISKAIISAYRDTSELI